MSNSIDVMKGRVSAVAVAIFVCGLAVQGFDYYMCTVTERQIMEELRNELPPPQFSQAQMEEENFNKDNDSNPAQSLFWLAIICFGGYYGAKNERTRSLCSFSSCNSCMCSCSTCMFCVLCVFMGTLGPLVAACIPELQHCDAWELCPLNEGRTPDANGLVADLHSIDCLAKGMWPEQYQRAYPGFGTPFGPQTQCQSAPTYTVLFLNCTANNAMTAIETAQHEETFRTELVAWPAHLLAEDTDQTPLIWPRQRRGHHAASAEERPPPMPRNVLEDCQANADMMEAFHHAKTLVPEIWNTVSMEVRVLQFLYAMFAILTGLGFLWAWQLQYLLKNRAQPWNRNVAQPFNAMTAEYTQPLISNAEYSQPWNPQQQAAQQAPQLSQSQVQPEVQPEIPAGQFVVTCPEFARAGHTISVTNPATGQQVECEVPAGVMPGQPFAVAV